MFNDQAFTSSVHHLGSFHKETSLFLRFYLVAKLELYSDLVCKGIHLV